jgi:hypothetical protein
LALIVASLRALLGASPAAASAAGSRYGWGTGTRWRRPKVYIDGERCRTLIGVRGWRRENVVGLGLTWATALGHPHIDFSHRHPYLFQLFAVSGHQKILRTAKCSDFHLASIKFVWVKTIQNQYKHIIG